MDIKRIAFLRGPNGQIETEQRFKAYKDELQAHDIRFEARAWCWRGITHA
jgi:DNA-binding LacI/PurR family transcriptional regulator